jgi:hypothetical protein
MADPEEGVAADGTIRTGARRDRVPAAFEPVLADAVAFIGNSGASLYVYGSVANGTVRPGSSDVDLLSIGLAGSAVLGRRLSARYADRCRGVEVAMATAAAFPADARAARGFNGDLGRHRRRWREALDSGTAAADELGVRVARKTLLAVAGLVSVHDRTWTTDRLRAVRRWSECEPGLAVQLTRLRSWAVGERRPGPGEVGSALADDGVVSMIVDRFDRLIGLWADDLAGQ